MPKKINTKGLACPEPVVMTKNALNKIDDKEELIVLVDKDVARENVGRLARNLGYNVEVNNKKDSYKLIISKQ